MPLTLRLDWEQRLPDVVAWVLAELVRLLERAEFRAAHRVVIYTPNMARELGLDPDSPRVYPHGARCVDTERFRPEVPFEEREDVVGFVGRLDEEKGIRELAEVAKRLPEDTTFRFVGDGPLYGWLERELSDEIETSRVELAGWVDHEDVPTELNRMKLLVMPSQPTEGLPTTILEALACGTPMYARPVARVPDVVREGETGRTMRSRDPTEIRQTIVDSLCHAQLPTYSERGREFVTVRYSFEAAVDRYRSLFETLPKGRQRGT